MDNIHLKKGVTAKVQAVMDNMLTGRKESTESVRW